MSEWISVEKSLPKAPIDEDGYLCRCTFRDNDYVFYMVLQYYALDKNPHFQYASGGLVVTHWQKIDKSLPD